ncbi:PadR family transcriptional regulator [Nocardiopsis sp. RSe5-2]|uniref:PadR family transcriptional regulator n=1 Tax=Nocardiopsis endophytica TaxID=3018445 RepID=A0ABT4TXE2_9ACTN|nr:PadR family transcriptional regulator [Nocardiopsis endophytica]MDA2809358.1 PadR family transcriptional regulator [Nocardiopsis endophytica]
MKLEHLLLGILALKPSTGYDLKRYMDAHGRFLRSNTQMSQVYRALGKMEGRGWVRHATEPRPGATDAKRYRLTDDGATVFLDWLTGPYHPPTRFEEPDLAARLAFAGFMSRDDVIRLLDAEIETRTNEIARYRFRDRSTGAEPVLPYDQDLAEYVAEWMHWTGANAKDAHIARVSELRDSLLRAPDREPLRPAVDADRADGAEGPGEEARS